MEIFNLESETHLSQCRKNAFAFIALFIVILSTYHNTFHSSWQFDDEVNIIENRPLHLDELNWEKAKKTFFASLDGKGALYRPVACFSFALNYYFGEDDVFGYHVVNLAIHFLASVFLFLFIYRTLNLSTLKAKYGPNSYFIALLSTTLWAINPLQTQAVTYIVQRMASMAGMFYIMSMFFYLKGRTSPNIGLKISHFLLCFATAILAFGSKENTAMLPISILLYDLFLIQGLNKENIKKNSYILIALVLIPIALAVILRGPPSLNFERLMLPYDFRDYSLIERLLTESRVVLFYITLLLYPMPDRLCLIHDVSVSHGLFNPPTTIISIFFIIVILAAAITKSKRWPLISYAILFFFLNHVIESSIFPLELIYEHRNYIPSMLFFVPITILMARGIRFFSYKTSMQVTLSIFIILVLVGFGHSTSMRNSIWKTEESLWLDAVEKSPNLSRAHHNLARYYGRTGQDDKAIAEYHLALKLKNPHRENDHVSHLNLSLIYDSRNQIDDAVVHLKEAIKINPRYADAYNNLGAMLIRKGEYDEAIDCFLRALTYDRKNYRAHYNLAVVLLKKGRLEEALGEVKEAFSLEGDFTRGLRLLGIIYKDRQELSKAKHWLRKALEKNERHIITRLHFMETLYLMKNEKYLETFLAETLSIIPPEKMKAVLEDLEEGTIQDPAPDLHIIFPLLGKAYQERSEVYRQYGEHYLGIEKEKHIR